ncbi:MAG TPA: hypothetical protein VLH61_06835 [Bacteroidales bacterium]|nr:hypothetical protein [Bacteroidales bacterium]
MRRHQTWVLALLVFLCPLVLRSQEAISFKLLATIPVSSFFFTTDPLGNLYWICENGLTRQEWPNGNRVQYSNQAHGRICLVEAGDPLNIMVFHPEFNLVLWLDRNLNPKAGPGVSPFGEEFPTTIGSSQLGGFWAFMPQKARLQRFNQAFRLQAQSLPFFEILPGFAPPSFIIESDGRIFVASPCHGIAMFDNFGNFLSLLQRKGITQFQVQNNHIIYFTNTEIVIFDVEQKQETLFLLPETQIRSGQLRGRYIFIQTEKNIKVYEASEYLF